MNKSVTAIDGKVLWKKERAANLAKCLVGYREEIQPIGKGGKSSRKIQVAVYDWCGERGTAREIAERLGMTPQSVYARIAAARPLKADARKPTTYDYCGRKMTAAEIAREVCGENCDRHVFKRTLARVCGGCLDPERLRAGRDFGNVYTFVDLDGKTRKGNTTEICRYYAKYHDIPFTPTVHRRVRDRLARCFSMASAFKVKDLFNDENFWHKRGTAIGNAKSSAV